MCKGALPVRHSAQEQKVRDGMRSYSIPAPRMLNVMQHRLRVNAQGKVIGDESLPLALPEDYVYRRIRAAAEKEGVYATTADGVVGRRGDMPITSQVAVYSRDERDVRDGLRPGLYADLSPGEEPIVIEGGGRHLQDMKEQIDEMRHYGTDALPERENPWPTSPTEMFWNLREMGVRLRKGRRTHGAMPSRQNTPHPGYTTIHRSGLAIARR
jgi:hypothetical protein